MQTQAHVLAGALKIKAPVGNSQATALAGGVRAKSPHTKISPTNAPPTDTGQANEIAADLTGTRRRTKTRAYSALLTKTSPLP